MKKTLVFLAIVFNIACMSPGQAAEKPKYREIKTVATTVRQSDSTMNFYNSSMNDGIVDIHGFVGSSSVCFTFKFVPKNSQVPYVPASLLVRLFDEDGNYLTHFLTQKHSDRKRDVEVGAASVYLDTKEVNQECYDISRMHADYTQLMEVGFKMSPSRF